MASSQLNDLKGYITKTLSFKSTPDGDIKVDVTYPEKDDGSPATVLIHYHGGFLIIGDRYSFLPQWLVHACVARNWIFVTPDYRLIPESTAHKAVEDAADAYGWVCSTLPGLIERSISSVLVAGSSAGAYLALTTSVTARERPSGLFLVYGMLDPLGERYTTPGLSLDGEAPIETGPVLKEFPMARPDGEETRKSITAFPTQHPDIEKRFNLCKALHIDAVFPDYMTGINGLSRAIAEKGMDAIPGEHAILFPLSFGNLGDVPRTMILHGLNDALVPADASKLAEEKLRAAGVEVLAEFPEDAKHGFDVGIGDMEAETPDGEEVHGVDCLRKAIRFLESSVTK